RHSAFPPRRTSHCAAPLPFAPADCGHHRDLHSLPHDALPISDALLPRYSHADPQLQTSVNCRLLSLQTLYAARWQCDSSSWPDSDRKSTRLNSSHVKTSYAVFCLKKKNNHRHPELVLRRRVLC